MGYVLHKAKTDLLDWFDSLSPDLVNQEYDILFETGWLLKRRTRNINLSIAKEAVVAGHLEILKRLNDKFRLEHSNDDLRNKGLNRQGYESNLKLKKSKKKPKKKVKKKSKKKKKKKKYKNLDFIVSSD